MESRSNGPDVLSDLSLSTPASGRRVSGAIRTSLIIIATVAVIWTLHWAKLFLIPLAVAIFSAIWLLPMVDGLQRLRVPRAFGAAFVLAAVLVACGGAAYALRDDARQFLNGAAIAAQHSRVAFNRATRDPDGWIHHLRSTFTDDAFSPVSADPHPAPNASVQDQGEFQFALLRSSTTVALAVVDVIVVLFLVYLLLASGDLFKRKLLIVISGHLARRRVTVEIINGIATQFQRYLVVLVTTNAAIGLSTWAAFSALGVDHAAVWGVAAGVLHIIPYLGPAAIALSSLLITSMQFNSLSFALIVASTSLLISTLIGIFLTTWLASRASHMNSVAVFAGLMFWGWLWGIPGLLLGTPLMMATKVLADRVACLNWLGTFLGGAVKRDKADKPLAEAPSIHTENPVAAAKLDASNPAIAYSSTLKAGAVPNVMALNNSNTETELENLVSGAHPAAV